MGIIRKDIIEISHLTQETRNSFGVTQDQLTFINNLLYRNPISVHNIVLNNLYKDGVDNVQFKLTSIEAVKLINCLLNGVDFQFIEYNTEEWHKIKLEEMKLKLIHGYVDYDIPTDE